MTEKDNVKAKPILADEEAASVDMDTTQTPPAGAEAEPSERNHGHENPEVNSCKAIVNGTRDALKAGQNNGEKYRKLFEFSHDSLMTLNGPSFLFSSGNPATCKMFGAKNEAEFISHSPWELSPEFQPDGRPSNEKAREMIEKAITEGFAFFPWTHRRLNGEEFPATALLTSMEINGEITVQATVRDITERKQAEKELRKSEERFRNVIDATGDYIFEVDVRGIITFISNRVRDILGYEPRELIGKTPFDLIGSPEEVARMSEIFGEHLAKKSSMKGEEHTCISKDGRELTVSVTAQPFFNDAGELNGYQGAVEDITNRKRAEEERKSLQAQLAHAQKMEAIGLLAGGVAHDLNNNLAPILGYTELVMDELDPNSTMKNDLEEVMNSGRRAAVLVKNLLGFSRKQPLTLSFENIGSIVDGFMSTIGKHVGAEIAIHKKISQDLWEAMVDISEVEAILGNLATNAMHAMPDGGTLSVETRNIHLDQNSLPKCEGAFAGDFVLLSIEDTGTGISPENLPLIFEPFFTTKAIGKGTGLGLARTFGTIRQLGGFISVKSKVGAGTRFEIYFPATGVNSKKSVKKETRERLFKGDETIIVVDDDASVRKLTARILTECGYRVKEAENAGSAYLQLEKMKKEGKQVHLILTDISMETVRGPELGKRVKNEYPETEVCYMSGYSNSDNPDMEGLEIIEKPFSSRELSKKIREALDAKKKKDSQGK